jgi:NADPH:quinone reductase-like Zn-dependent oxidoreductase
VGTPSGTRKAVVVRRHGGPEVLQVEDVPAADPGPGEVRLRVTHVGVNHLDVWVRRGVPGHDFHLPRILGSDTAGEAEGARWALHPSWGCGVCPACLRGRQDRCPTFRIRGESADGACATEVVVPRWQLLPVPDTMTSEEAASLPLTLLTAWHMLVTRAGLQRGERVLVQAGGSGVGVMAVQIARLFGCEVHATASTQGKRAKLAALGATAWSYEDVGERAGVRNVDVVVENVGTPTWARSLKALAWGGRLVTCGATAGAEVGLDLRALFFKQQSVLGSTMGSSGEMVAAWREVLAGRILPVVGRVLPMSQLGEAQALLERREVFGKVVVRQDLG